jgi:hypothetical protein
MKNLFLGALAGIVIVAAGCVSTVSGTHSPAVTWSRDSVQGRYERTLDQVYQASVQVILHNGVLLTEYIPHDNTNAVRSLSGKVNDLNVWIRVEAVDPNITEVTVQARSSWGVSDVDLPHELEKEIALQLAR